MNRPGLDFWRIVNALTLLKAQKSYLRVGQILVNSTPPNYSLDLFHISDEDLADALEAQLGSKIDPP